MSDTNHLMALDLGEQRIGVALASHQTKLPKPLVTLSNDQDLVSNLKDLIKEHNVDVLVVGLPRNLEGNATSQTNKVKELAEKLSKELAMKIEFQDEALSSVRAKEDIERLKGHSYDKSEIDKLAACYILEDYLRQDG